ncbi:hypothetical protein AKJ65_04970 [candidate division MSBL1 archaeon SCGC-AAA259E19]|uniref:MoaB/Mog domain-containing protein n=1 Tax=candidate division MSBL1 archaeon SCGC-AAA259E19 TaxID=1698264 RepID=A0A133UJC2_9EURY|nr:hypothetical protein AKJ65_04970 [candidate division MSBL1 archaeon SCGC-AAA259E19]
MSNAGGEKDGPQNLHVEVVTVSDTRAKALKEGQDIDESGKIIQRRLEESGFSSDRTVLPDEEGEITEKIEELIDNSDVDALITTGGTGLASRDKTVDAIRPLFEREILGFGEILRRKGYEQVGAPALTSRTTAGIAGKKPIFCLPGPPNAVKVGMDLILQDLPDIVRRAKK